MDIDECASSPCQHGGTCNNLVNGFKCTCTEGYYDHMCVSDINECASDPCLNGGQCVDGIHRLAMLKDSTVVVYIWTVFRATKARLNLTNPHIH